MLERLRAFPSILALVRANMQLLARKIIERAGQTGEHYITVSRGEYWKMLASAGGGGVLTAGTAALKFFVYTLAGSVLMLAMLIALYDSTPAAGRVVERFEPGL